MMSALSARVLLVLSVTWYTRAGEPDRSCALRQWADYFTKLNLQRRPSTQFATHSTPEHERGHRRCAPLFSGSMPRFGKSGENV